MIIIPNHAPMPMMGSIARFSENVSHDILSHTKIWRGTFSRFTTRKNHAFIPIYSILSFRIESKYTDSTGPAALPIIVVKPPSKPNRAEYHHLLIHLFSLPNSSLHIITTRASARVHPINWRNSLAGINLSTNMATKNPSIAVGSSLTTTFQSAIRL